VAKLQAAMLQAAIGDEYREVVAGARGERPLQPLVKLIRRAAVPLAARYFAD
jgi:hypothetical protein